MRAGARTLSAIVAAGTLAGGLSGFQDGGTFRVSVNLVQVDAVVTDAKGHHVSDLTADDFEVTEDGKPRKITNFSWIAVRPADATRAGNMAAGDVRRSMVLMIDDSGPFAEQDVLPVITAAHKFVADQIAPGDLVSVTASRGGMGFYQQFTSDKRQLNAAIDRLAQRPGFGRWTIAPPVLLDENGDEAQVKMAPDEPAYSYRAARPNPLAHLMWAIQGLAGTPGRKAVVLFSRAFAAPKSIVEMANRAGVVIYVIDPHGTDLRLDLVSTTHGTELHATGRMADSTAPYRVLAQQTGGLFLISAPGADLTSDLGKVLEDMSGYYLIGYRTDRNRPHGEIQVKVRRKGLTVRARNGYLGAPPEESRAGQAAYPTGALERALFSPFNAGHIRLRVDAIVAASRPDAANRQRAPILQALLEADGRDLVFQDTPEGRKRLVYSVLVAVFQEDGTPSASRQQTFTVDVTPEEASRVAASGLHTSLAVRLAKAGPYQIRAAVRDEGAGETGSAYSFVEAPDFNRPQIALSSISLASPGTRQASGAAWDEYAAGTSIGFECEVFGFRSGARPAAQPRVEMQIRLFRQGANAPVFDSKPFAVPKVTLAENFLAGRLSIGSDFAPGDYTMQLVVYDRLQPSKKQVATQWTSLTVVKPKANLTAPVLR